MSIVNISLTKNIINWFLENITLEVDEEQRNNYLTLKKNVEGWKKGTQVRNPKQNVRNTIDIIKENLSLYLNQISNSNYDIIKKKIINEIDNSLEAQDLFIELILNNCLSQVNNLPLIVELLLDLKYIPQLVLNLEKQLYDGKLRETDPNNYDQLCIDNKNNLVHKNGFLFLGMIFNKSNEITISKQLNYFDLLEANIIDETHSKDLSEKYIDIYVEFIRLVGAQLKKTSNDIYNDILNKLIKWKDMRQRFTNRARFSILDYLDEIENNN